MSMDFRCKVCSTSARPAVNPIYFGGSYKKDESVLGSILGAPPLWLVAMETTTYAFEHVAMQVVSTIGILFGSLPSFVSSLFLHS